MLPCVQQLPVQVCLIVANSRGRHHILPSCWCGGSRVEVALAFVCVRDGFMAGLRSVNIHDSHQGVPDSLRNNLTASRIQISKLSNSNFVATCFVDLWIITA